MVIAQSRRKLGWAMSFFGCVCRNHIIYIVGCPLFFLENLEKNRVLRVLNHSELAKSAHFFQFFSCKKFGESEKVPTFASAKRERKAVESAPVLRKSDL